MTDKTVRGRFVWHELMTPDTSDAHSFYSKTLGWKTQASDQVPDYSMFVAGSGPLGGSVQLLAGASHWLAYIGTPDIEATVAQAQELGAKVVREIEEIPGGGAKYAVLNDPQGAAFAVYSPPGDPGRDKPAKRGEFSWHELMTTDAKAALDFYSELFGWEKREAHDMGPMGFYYLFGRNGMEVGGMFDKPADVPGGSAWLAYVRVKDVEQTVKKVKSAGGTLTNGPMEVPGGDRIAQFVDPQGAAFAVHMLKADMATPAQAEEEADEAPVAANGEDEDEIVEESAAPEPVVAKPKKKAAAKPAKKVAVTAAKKKAAPPAKVRAAAKGAKRPAAKASKAPAKKAAAKAGKAKAGKAKAGKKAKVAKAKVSKGKVSKVKVTKGTRAAGKKPARKK